MNKIFLLLLLPVFSFSQVNGELNRKVAASYYIDIKIGNNWVQVEEVDDTLDIYIYRYTNNRIDILFPNHTEYILGKLQNCITLNSCFTPITFTFNDNLNVYTNKESGDIVVLNKDDDGNIISITLEFSDQYRIRHNLIVNKINVEIDDRKGLTKNQFFENYIEACNNSIQLNNSEGDINLYLSNYCNCMASKIRNKFKTLSFNDEYIMKVNSIDWESNETILWMNDCSENYLFKKQAKKIRKNN